ncbi:hypothetical protein ERJ75_001152100 [Trypanosoma vivax]|nr:hypothetical protein ERJ75_001152100 [Trypanosoma vivax]
MEAEPNRLVNAIAVSKARRTRVAEFVASLPLLMALGAGPAKVERVMLRHAWDLMLHIVRLRASVNFQFVFSHFGVPCNEATDKATEQGNTKPHSHPAWSADVVTGVEGKVRNEMYRAFREGRVPRMHHSVPLDRVRPAPKRSAVDRLGGP